MLPVPTLRSEGMCDLEGEAQPQGEGPAEDLAGGSHRGYVPTCLSPAPAAGSPRSAASSFTAWAASLGCWEEGSRLRGARALARLGAAAPSAQPRWPRHGPVCRPHMLFVPVSCVQRRQAGTRTSVRICYASPASQTAAGSFIHGAMTAGLGWGGNGTGAAQGHGCRPGPPPGATDKWRKRQESGRWRWLSQHTSRTAVSRGGGCRHQRGQGRERAHRERPRLQLSPPPSILGPAWGSCTAGSTLRLSSWAAKRTAMLPTPPTHPARLLILFLLSDSSSSRSQFLGHLPQASLPQTPLQATGLCQALLLCPPSPCKIPLNHTLSCFLCSLAKSES